VTKINSRLLHLAQRTGYRRSSGTRYLSTEFLRRERIGTVPPHEHLNCNITCFGRILAVTLGADLGLVLKFAMDTGKSGLVRPRGAVRFHIPLRRTIENLMVKKWRERELDAQEPASVIDQLFRLVDTLGTVGQGGFVKLSSRKYTNCVTASALKQESHTSGNLGSQDSFRTQSSATSIA
jgi:hypothetical protein